MFFFFAFYDFILGAFFFFLIFFLHKVLFPPKAVAYTWVGCVVCVCVWMVFIFISLWTNIIRKTFIHNIKLNSTMGTRCPYLINTSPLIRRKSSYIRFIELFNVIYVYTYKLLYIVYKNASGAVLFFLRLSLLQFK